MTNFGRVHLVQLDVWWVGTCQNRLLLSRPAQLDGHATQHGDEAIVKK